jgi:hypothetical protein
MNRSSTLKCGAKTLLLPIAAVAASLAVLPIASASRRAVPRLVFPVVGPVSYVNDFGEPRGGLRHQGNDLIAKKKSLVVAVEAGKIEFWTHSASAGCMLYLYGRSGTMYEYIHLNNDLTMKNDNRGKCKPGISYAKGLRNGARVEAGEPIGYVGDSGDANGIASHLHFEVHPHGGAAVSPYPYLKRAQVLLFAAEPEQNVSLTLVGTYLSSDSTLGTLTMRVRSLRASTGLHMNKLSRKVELALPIDALVSDSLGTELSLDHLDSLASGDPITVETTESPATLKTELAAPFALTVEAVTIDD